MFAIATAFGHSEHNTLKNLQGLLASGKLTSALVVKSLYHSTPIAIIIRPMIEPTAEDPLYVRS